MLIFNKKLRWISAFVISLITIGLVLSYQSLNYEFLYYGAVVAAEIALILYMEKRVGFSKLLLWNMAIWCALHFAGGLMPIPPELAEVGRPANLYNLKISPYFPRFDQLVHTYGFGVATAFAYQAMRAHFKSFPINPANFAILFLCGAGLGAMNEVIEFFAVLIMPQTNVGGYNNTCWDLVCNCIGAIIAISLIRLKQLPSAA